MKNLAQIANTINYLVLNNHDTHDCEDKNCESCKKINELRDLISSDTRKVKKAMPAEPRNIYYVSANGNKEQKYRWLKEIQQQYRLNPATVNNIIKTGKPYKKRNGQKVTIRRVKNDMFVNKNYKLYVITDKFGRTTKFRSLNRLAMYASLPADTAREYVENNVTKDGYTFSLEILT